MKTSDFFPLLDACISFFDELENRDLLRKVIRTAIHFIEAERGSIFLKSTFLGRPPGTLVAFFASESEKSIEVGESDGIVGYTFRTASSIVSNDVKVDPRFDSKTDLSTGFKTRSILSVPLKGARGEVFGVFQVLNKKDGKFSDEDLKILQVLSGFASFSLEKLKVVSGIEELREELKKTQSSEVRISNSPGFQKKMKQLEVIAPTDLSVLITGENGSGKEVLAKWLHDQSLLSKGPFVAVNCAAIPETLFEAEMFGVVAGAATGVVARKGKMQMANGGTLFLDEIGELPPMAQAKLLRALQDQEIQPVGSDSKPVSVHFRLITATNRDIERSLVEKTLREDLFYRINGFQIRVPALRERVEDISFLGQKFLNEFSKRNLSRKKTFSREAFKAMVEYPWPGNIRELKHKIETAAVLSGENATIQSEDLFRQIETVSRSVTKDGDHGGPLQLNLKTARRLMEMDLLEKALQASKGNKGQAARLLGISREGLRKLQSRNQQS